MQGLPPECELLVRLARPFPPVQDINRARVLITTRERPLDWARFTDQAGQHQIAPLVYRGIRLVQQGDDAPSVDVTAMSFLRAAYHYSAERNSRIQAEIGRILTAAAAESIPVVLRKGGHLAFHVYPDPGLRPMADLDLLADRDTARRLVAMLERLGYAESKSEDEPLTRRERIFWHLYGSDLPQLRRYTGDPYWPAHTIDISVALALPGTSPEVPLPAIIGRAGRVTVGRQPALVLSPVDTVLDLCLNLFKNSTALRFMAQGKHRRLLKYVDIAECVRHFGADFSWTEVMTRVAEYDLGRPVLYSLARLDRLYPDVVPPGVLDELKTAHPDWQLLLGQYGQWDLPEPARHSKPFPQQFFDRSSDAELPASRSLV